MALKLAQRGGKAAKKRAAVAVARKLAVVLHRLWLTQQRYEPLRENARETVALPCSAATQKPETSPDLTRDVFHKDDESKPVRGDCD